MPLGIDPLVNFAFVKLFASEGNEPINLRKDRGQSHVRRQ